jgi:hypothetical protein
MPPKPLTINGKQFAKRGAAIDHFRSMLNRHSIGQVVHQPDADDLADLVLRHPEAVEKIGTGIDHFEIRAAPQFGGQCFWIVRTDGSATDFSFMTCVRGKGKTVSQEFREACRMAIQNDVAKAKQAYFDQNQDGSGRVACEVTGQALTIDEAHADHRDPMRFEVIVAAFLASKNRDEPDSAWLTKSKDRQAVTTFVDIALRDEFRAFHKRLARLRWIEKRENLSLGGSGQLRHAKGSIQLK